MSLDNINYLLSDDAAWREVERRVAVRVVQIEHVHAIPGKRVEKRLLSGPRLLTSQLPPEIPSVQPASEIAAEEVHERTGAVEGGDGGDEKGDGAAGDWGGERQGGGGAGRDGPEKGDVDPREAGGEEPRRDGGAVERAVAPPAHGVEAAGVVLVEVRQEVGLAAAAELIHGHHSFVHGSPVASRQCAAAASRLLRFWVICDLSERVKEGKRGDARQKRKC